MQIMALQNLLSFYKKKIFKCQTKCFRVNYAGQCWEEVESVAVEEIMTLGHKLGSEQ